MPTTIFDLRTNVRTRGLVAACNRWLSRNPGNRYQAAHGDVCSERWWESVDAGRVPLRVRSGTVRHAGPAVDEFSGEAIDIIELVADDTVWSYDRDSYWRDADIRVGDLLRITLAVITIEARYERETWEIVTRVELDEAEPRGPRVAGDASETAAS